MNLDQARAVAEEYFNGGRDDPVELGLYAFGDGYVVWAKPPEPDDPSVLPETVGGGCVVIDRHTGEVAIRPLLDPETVAEQWPGRHPR
ncbi:hypothetical protein ACFXJ8_30015 [Nonomuraea sp. NPDC059194]|uniref:hypothetical protein n=1 Tax=Nonomuraea sp. NPDC059194 TaxID=3346764 RepID=UPI0036A9499C